MQQQQQQPHFPNWRRLEKVEEFCYCLGGGRQGRSRPKWKQHHNSNKEEEDSTDSSSRQWKWWWWSSSSFQSGSFSFSFSFVFFLIPAAWSFWLVLPFLLLLFIIAENCYLFGHKSGGDSGSFLFEGIIIFIFFLLIVCLGINSNVSRCISRVVAGGVRWIWRHRVSIRLSMHQQFPLNQITQKEFLLLLKLVSSW